MSLCFLSTFNAQTILSINIELSEQSLKIYHDNTTNNCTLRDTSDLSVLCPTMTHAPAKNTQNIQLPLPLNVLRFAYGHSEVYISELEHDGYFCMIEINLEDKSCTRVMIHYAELGECFSKMLGNREPPRVDDCVAATYEKQRYLIARFYNSITLGILILLGVAFTALIYLTTALVMKIASSVINALTTAFCKRRLSEKTGRWCGIKRALYLKPPAFS